MKGTVFVLDDHPIVREGLIQLIDREPLILDISLNGPDGLDLLKNIRTKDPSLPVPTQSMHDESIYAERALRAGANGYIMKQEATENVLIALRRILGREIYVSSRVASKMLQHPGRQLTTGYSPRAY